MSISRFDSTMRRSKCLTTGTLLVRSRSLSHLFNRQALFQQLSSRFVGRDLTFCSFVFYFYAW